MMINRIAPPFSRPLAAIIPQRFSCRVYDGRPIAPEQAGALAAFAATIGCGPLGTPVRFEVAVAGADDAEVLRGLLRKEPFDHVDAVGHDGGEETRQNPEQ